MLVRHYGWTPRLEKVLFNPYLEDYYKDLKRWSLNLEVYFLKERFRDLLEISRSTETIIQDRSIFEGVYIFAANNYAMGNMSDDDFDTFMGLFDSMMMVAHEPDLMVYLKASVPHLVDNIHKRGREYEQNIQLNYLQNLNDRYEEFVNNTYQGRVLTIEVTGSLPALARKDFASVINASIPDGRPAQRRPLALQARRRQLTPRTPLHH
jgi:deoxyadenosine/deoxycytidine kinase